MNWKSLGLHTLSIVVLFVVFNRSGLTGWLEANLPQWIAMSIEALIAVLLKKAADASNTPDPIPAPTVMLEVNVPPVQIDR